MRLILLMGGQGRRFKEAGYTLSKPLLMLGEKRLIQWAIDGLPSGSFHYLVTPELNALPWLHTLLPAGSWHVLSAPTTGPLLTCLALQESCQTTEELLLADCDSFMERAELEGAIEIFRARHAQGGVTVRRTTDPMCSFVRLSPEWVVEETREQDPFSPWSSTGPYWFASGEQFLTAARRAHQAQQVSIAPVYNYLRGQTVAVPVGSFHHVGTPAALAASQRDLQLFQRLSAAG